MTARLFIEQNKFMNEKMEGKKVPLVAMTQPA